MAVAGEGAAELAGLTLPRSAVAADSVGLAPSRRGSGTRWGRAWVRVEIAVAGRAVRLGGAGVSRRAVVALLLPESVSDSMFARAVCAGRLATPASTATAIQTPSIEHVVVARTRCRLARGRARRSVRPFPLRGYTLRHAGAPLTRPAKTSSICPTNSSCESSCSAVSWTAVSSNSCRWGASVCGCVSASDVIGTCELALPGATGSSLRLELCCIGILDSGGGSNTWAVALAPRRGLRARRALAPSGGVSTCGSDAPSAMGDAGAAR